MVSNRLQPQIDTCMSAETVKWPVSLSWCILNVPYFGFLKKSNNSHFNNGVCPECTAHVPQPSLQSILQLLAVCLHLLLQWLPPTNPEMSQRTHRYQWCCWKSFQYPATKVYFEVRYWWWKVINIAFLYYQCSSKGDQRAWRGLDMILIITASLKMRILVLYGSYLV